MPEHPLTRRRSPGWIRAYSSRSLHGLAMRLMNLRSGEDLSDAQEWLWDAVISELEYRRRRDLGRVRACSCMLCVPPFPEPD